MTTTTDRYINLFTDFGFKKLFGEEKMTIAKNALASGLSVATVAQLTGLSEAEIRLLTE